MHIIDIYRNNKTVFSIEIFPPKTDQGITNLKVKLDRYLQYAPHFISVTYGAGGGTRENTHKLASYIKNELGIESMAHLTCVSHSEGEISQVLNQLHESGIENIMALRGDPPKDQTHFEPTKESFQYASELIAALKSRQGFGIGAAGYPEGHVDSISWEQDQQHLIQKIEAGAEFIISQFFLNNDDFLRWRDYLSQQGVTVPLIPGILPAQSVDQITRFARMCGCQLPVKLMQRLEAQQDSAEAMRQIGVDFAAQQVEALAKEGVAGFHLYALNRVETVEQLAPLMTPAQS